MRYCPPRITDAVLEEVKEWQSRPLEQIYPIICLDALVVKVRGGHQVKNRAAHIAVDLDLELDGIKHLLGIRVLATEGAKFWAGICAELANRGVMDGPHCLLRRSHRFPRGHRSDLAPRDPADLCGAPDPCRHAVRQSFPGLHPRSFPGICLGGPVRRIRDPR